MRKCGGYSSVVQCIAVRIVSINQSINQTSIASISPAKPGSKARQPNQCSTAKSRKQFQVVFVDIRRKIHCSGTITEIMSVVYYKRSCPGLAKGYKECVLCQYHHNISLSCKYLLTLVQAYITAWVTFIA